MDDFQRIELLKKMRSLLLEFDLKDTDLLKSAYDMATIFLNASMAQYQLEKANEDLKSLLDDDDDQRHWSDSFYDSMDTEDFNLF